MKILLHILPILSMIICSQMRSDEVVLRIRSDFLGKDVEFVLTESRLSKSPRWAEDADNPPLPPRKAVKATMDYLKALVKDSSSWRTEGIRLAPMGNGGMWIYIVEVRPPGPVEGKRVPSNVVVLM